MSKLNLKLWLFSVVLILVRILDAYLTYVITPDLRYEANPLVSIWNHGWMTLFFVNIIVVLLCILLLYYSMKYPSNSFPSEKDYSFKEFVSYYLYNDKNAFHKIYFIPPYNRKSILSFCGFTFTRIFILWSIVVVIHNLGILFSETYRYYINLYRLWIYLYSLLIPITFYYFWIFFRIEYKKYKNNSSYSFRYVQR